MKKFILSFAVFLAFMGLPVMNVHADTGAPAAEIITVEANGLICDFCARSLEKVFMKRGDVAAISVDLDSKLITITMKSSGKPSGDQGGSIDDETVTKLITDAGYSVVSITRSAQAGSGDLQVGDGLDRTTNDAGQDHSMDHSDGHSDGHSHEGDHVHEGSHE